MDGRETFGVGGPPVEGAVLVASPLASLIYLQAILLSLQRLHIDPGIFCAHLTSPNSVNLAEADVQDVPTFSFCRRHSVHAINDFSLLSMAMGSKTEQKTRCRSTRLISARRANWEK
jgi:hypothetical protein